MSGLYVTNNQLNCKDWQGLACMLRIINWIAKTGKVWPVCYKQSTGLQRLARPGLYVTNNQLDCKDWQGLACLLQIINWIAKTGNGLACVCYK